LEGKAVEITDANFEELDRLCQEFGFSDFSAKLSEFRPSKRFKETEDGDPHERIAILEENANQRDHFIAVLESEVRRLSTDFERLVGEVSALRSASAGIQTLSEEVSALQTRITEMSSAVVFSPNQPPPPSPAAVQPSLQQSSVPSALSFDSQIISDFPEIFAEFGGKRFSVLWRGSRDGFKAKEFHRRCDGHANTLTVVLDTNGNIFGGFTPLKWESRVVKGDGKNCLKADDSLKSFLFTLKNPHNIPARRFALKAEKKHWAINCDCKRGPDFANNDIRVFDDCNANTRNDTSLGWAYTNDTGLGNEIVFTGSRHFQVKEIEVFEITD
jgi:hypothetical protein